MIDFIGPVSDTAPNKSLCLCCVIIVSCSADVQVPQSCIILMAKMYYNIKGFAFNNNNNNKVTW